MNPRSDVLRAGDFSCLIVEVMATFLVAASAQAGTESRTNFNIVQESADKALIEFARQAEVSVLFPTDRINQITARVLSGNYTVEEALSILLRDTGLSADLSASGVLTIKLSNGFRGTDVKNSPLGNSRLGSVVVLCGGLIMQPGTLCAQEPGGAERVSVELEEVIVTAERRETSLQRSAAAVTALAGADLLQQGKTNLDDVLRTVPGVAIQGGQTTSTVYIRGVGPTQTVDPSVSLSVDGVYQTNGFVNANYDVERVEVLKGPQGLLYGRNATGGAVNLITNNPTLDGYHASGSLQVGNYEAVRAEASFNAPLTDNLAFRGAFLSNQHQGYLSNGSQDDDSTAARAKLLYKPNENLSILVGADYTHIGGLGSGQYVVPNNSPQTLFWVASGYSANTTHPSPPAYNTTRPAGRVDSRKYGFYGQVDYDLGFGALTYIPAYYAYFNHIDLPSPLLPGTFGATSTGQLIPGGWSTTQVAYKQMTHELRLSSPDDARVRWLTGLYYIDHKAEAQGDFSAPLAPNQTDTATGLTYTHSAIGSALTINPLNETESWAAFGQVTYPLTEAIRLTGGARYTHDTKTAVYKRVNSSRVVIDGTNILDIDHNTNAVTWKAGLEYDVAARSLLFANIARGFKAGGFGNATPNSTYTVWTTPTYQPEFLTEYEIGSKNRFLNGRLQVNADVFYYDYTNQQQFILAAGLNLGSAPRAIIINVPRSHSYGADVETVWVLSAADRLNVSVVYNNTRFGSFLYGPTSSGLTVDKSGSHWAFAPLWQENIGYERAFTLANGATLTAAADLRFSSSYNTTIELHPDAIQPSYHRSDARLTYAPTDGHYSLSVFVNNIENVAVRQFTYGYVSPSQTPANGFFQTQLAPPRTYGAQISASF